MHTPLLPADVLLEVFSLVCAHSTICSHVDTPIALARVCRLWRDTAKHKHSLWSSFDIGCADMHSQATQCLIVPYLLLHLQRSGDAPLDITIHHTPQMHEYVLSSILLHSARWRSLDIDARVAIRLQAYPVKGHLPLLRHLHVRHLASMFAQPQIDIFSKAPMLTSCTSDIELQGLQLPYPQLRELNARSASSAWLDRNTPQLRMLKYLTYSIPYGFPMLTIPPSIETLTLLLDEFPGIDWFDAAEPFRALPPALRQLRFQAHNYDDEANALWAEGVHKALVRSLEQHRPSALALLAFRHVCFQPGQLSELLRAAPAVSDLEIWEPLRTELRGDPGAVAETLLAELIWDDVDASEILLPHLRRLAIFNARAMDESVLVDMVASRGQPSPLQTLIFCYCSGRLEPHTAMELARVIGRCDVGRDPELTAWWSTLDDEDCRNAFFFRS